MVTPAPLLPFRYFIGIDFDDAYPEEAAKAAGALYSAIQSTPPFTKRQSAFCAEVRNFLFVLREYNNIIYEERNAFPYSEQLMETLELYVETEYYAFYAELIYPEGSEERKRLEEGIKQRVLLTLGMMLPCKRDMKKKDSTIHPYNVELTSYEHILQVLKNVKKRILDRRERFVFKTIEFLCDHLGLTREANSVFVNGEASVGDIWQNRKLSLLTEVGRHPSMDRRIPDTEEECHKLYCPPPEGDVITIDDSDDDNDDDDHNMSINLDPDDRNSPDGWHISGSSNWQSWGETAGPSHRPDFDPEAADPRMDQQAAEETPLADEAPIDSVSNIVCEPKEPVQDVPVEDLETIPLPTVTSSPKKLVTEQPKIVELKATPSDVTSIVTSSPTGLDVLADKAMEEVEARDKHPIEIDDKSDTEFDLDQVCCAIAFAKNKDEGPPVEDKLIIREEGDHIYISHSSGPPPGQCVYEQIPSFPFPRSIPISVQRPPSVPTSTDPIPSDTSASDTTLLDFVSRPPSKNLHSSDDMQKLPVRTKAARKEVDPIVNMEVTESPNIVETLKPVQQNENKIMDEPPSYPTMDQLISGELVDDSVLQKKSLNESNTGNETNIGTDEPAGEDDSTVLQKQSNESNTGNENNIGTDEPPGEDDSIFPDLLDYIPDDQVQNNKDKPEDSRRCIQEEHVQCKNVDEELLNKAHNLYIQNVSDISTLELFEQGNIIEDSYAAGSIDHHQIISNVEIEVAPCVTPELRQENQPQNVEEQVLIEQTPMEYQEFASEDVTETVETLNTSDDKIIPSEKSSEIVACAVVALDSLDLSGGGTVEIEIGADASSSQSHTVELLTQQESMQYRESEDTKTIKINNTDVRVKVIPPDQLNQLRCEEVVEQILQLRSSEAVLDTVDPQIMDQEISEIDLAVQQHNEIVSHTEALHSSKQVQEELPSLEIEPIKPNIEMPKDKTQKREKDHLPGTSKTPDRQADSTPLPGTKQKSSKSKAVKSKQSPQASPAIGASSMFDLIKGRRKAPDFTQFFEDTEQSDDKKVPPKSKSKKKKTTDSNTQSKATTSEHRNVASQSSTDAAFDRLKQSYQPAAHIKPTQTSAQSAAHIKPTQTSAQSTTADTSTNSTKQINTPQSHQSDTNTNGKNPSTSSAPPPVFTHKKKPREHTTTQSRRSTHDTPPPPTKPKPNRPEAEQAAHARFSKIPPASSKRSTTPVRRKPQQSRADSDDYVRSPLENPEYEEPPKRYNLLSQAAQARIGHTKVWDAHQQRYLVYARNRRTDASGSGSGSHYTSPDNTADRQYGGCPENRRTF